MAGETILINEVIAAKKVRSMEQILDVGLQAL